jgi:hypothetical protein
VRIVGVPALFGRAIPAGKAPLGDEEYVMTVRNEVAGAGQFLADRRVEALLLGEARRRVFTRMFGIPGEDQSLLVTLILAGSVATAVGGVLPRVFRLPSGGDVVIGGAALNATVGAMAGVTSRTAPLAGGLITLAVVAHALRPAVAASRRESRAVMHRARAAYDARYAS